MAAALPLDAIPSSPHSVPSIARALADLVLTVAPAVAELVLVATKEARARPVAIVSAT
jgi:hypothetical protein